MKLTFAFVETSWRVASHWKSRTWTTSRFFILTATTFLAKSRLKFSLLSVSCVSKMASYCGNDKCRKCWHARKSSSMQVTFSSMITSWQVQSHRKLEILSFWVSQFPAYAVKNQSIVSAATRTCWLTQLDRHSLPRWQPSLIASPIDDGAAHKLG